MTRVWVRLAVAVLAVAATVAIAIGALVVGPVQAEAERSAGRAAAREARLVAEVGRLHGAVPAGIRVSTEPSQGTGGVAFTGDGRFVQVAGEPTGPLVRVLWRGAALVGGTTLLAIVGWAMWGGAVRSRRLAEVGDDVLRLARGDYAAVAATRPRLETAALNGAVGVLRQELRQAAREQAVTIGVMAHDLRSPLAGIELAAERLAHVEDDVARTQAQAAIRRECRRVALIADDVLALCQHQEAAIGGDAPTPVGALLEDVAERIRSTHDGSVVVRVDGAATVHGRAEAPLVRSVGNLAENAARHSPAGGEVRLLARTVGNGVEIAVEDDGPGLAPGYADGAFRQGDGTVGRSGLGLASVRRLVRAHGGELQPQQSPSGGARMVIRLAGRPTGGS